MEQNNLQSTNNAFYEKYTSKDAILWGGQEKYGQEKQYHKKPRSGELRPKKWWFFL